MKTNWAAFKNYVNSLSLSIQYTWDSNYYYLWLTDGTLSCDIQLQSDDATDFLLNFQPNANQSNNQNVTTQFEKNDKVLKLASLEGTLVSGATTLSIKIPGTPGTAEGRWIAGGFAFTDVWTKGDRLTTIEIKDNDNITGQGAGTTLKSYADLDLDPLFQGWRMWPSSQVGGEIEIDPIGGYGFVPAGLYLEISFQMATGSAATWVCCDIWWGKNE
jgi:hypothetical protein